MMSRDVAIENLRKSLEFYDRVNAASEDEKITVGADHWNWLEQAAREVVAASAPVVTFEGKLTGHDQTAYPTSHI